MFDNEKCIDSGYNHQVNMWQRSLRRHQNFSVLVCMYSLHLYSSHIVWVGVWSDIANSNIQKAKRKCWYWYLSYENGCKTILRIFSRTSWIYGDSLNSTTNDISCWHKLRIFLHWFEPTDIQCSTNYLNRRVAILSLFTTSVYTGKSYALVHPGPWEWNCKSIRKLQRCNR